MNDIMAYQYPSPGTPPPPYNTGYTVAPHMTGMPMRSPDQPGRNGSPAISFDLKRATSQPNIKLDPESEESNMASAAEKKRNKLGYHRASAACSEKHHPNCPPTTPDQLILTDHFLGQQLVVDTGKYGVGRALPDRKSACSARS